MLKPRSAIRRTIFRPRGTPSLSEGAYGANIALLGNYIASSFAMASNNHGGTVVADASIPNDQPLLSNPRHA